MSSSNTETRILQMQLENKDFEDGIRQTIKSLENLEEKLDLKNAGDGFEKVSAAANSVQMSHLESGLDSVTSKFTLMGQIGLQVLERISSRVVDTAEKVLRAATIQPMIDGWSEFEMKTNSVQTILGGIRNSFEDQPTAINAISEALDELNDYADKTIYNFAQMTENVGKFTNQGLGLEESTNAIKGIANWAAAVGADPAQMSRAMYNISQSLGAGSMQLIDWRSIRFANMATPEVKKLFAEVAKKVNPGAFDKKGMVKVSKKQKVDVLQDFESSLKAGWLTNEVMAEAFGIYANAFSKEDLIARYGEELGTQFYEMGVYAEEAATKVRTFSQLLGVLQESLGSGWASTFDILFGGFEQQTAFLTNVKELFEEIIDDQTESRNTWLQNFSDSGGVIAFQNTILNIISILTKFYWVFKDVVSVVFDPFTGTGAYTNFASTWEHVAGIFNSINSSLEQFKTWMDAANAKSGRSPLENLTSALAGVAGAAGIAWQVLKGFGKFAMRIFKRFEPLISSVLDLVGQLGSAVYYLFFNLTGQQSIEKLFDTIGDAVEPVVGFVVDLAAAVVDLVHSFLGIDRAADDWTVLGDRIEAFWKIFQYDTDLSFADNIRNSLRNAMIAVFGRDTAYGILNAWDTNIKPVLEQISGFFEQAFGDLGRVIEGIRKASEADYSNGNAFDTFLSAFLGGFYSEDAKGAESSYTNILGVYEQIVNYYNEHVAQYVDELVKIFTVTLPNLSAQITDFLFGKEKKYVIGPGKYQTVRKGGLVQSIKDMFSQENVNEAVTSVQTFFDSIAAGIGVAFDGFFEYIFGHEITGKQGNTWREGGLIQSVQELFELDVWKEDWALIEGALEQVSSWITSKGGEAWNTIMDFLFGKQEVVSDRNGANLTSHYERQGGAYEAAIAFLTPVWEWIQSTGKALYEYITTHNFQEMWEGLDHLLFGYDEVVANRNGPSLTSSMVHHDGLLGPVVEVLKPIADVFGQIKDWALEKIGNIDWGGIWESLGRFFGGYDEVVASYDGGNLTSKTIHHEGIFEKIIGFFERVIDYFESPEFQEFFANVKTFYHTYIEPVLSWLGGLGGELWGAVEGLFSGQGLGALDGVATYLTKGINDLFGSLFPEGFDLSGILGGLFGNGQQTSNGTPTKNQTGGSGGFLDFVGSLLMGTAGAAEAETSNIVDASGAIVADLSKIESAVGETTGEGTGIMDLILGNVSKFLPYIGGAAAIGLTGKVSDLIVGVTGNRKPTIIEQITGLLRALGEPLKDLGIAIAAAGFAETISPGSLDKVFKHITDLLETVFSWVAWIAGGGTVLSIAGNLGGNALNKKLFGGASGAKVSESMNFDSASTIISSIGTGLSGVFEALQTLYNLAWEFVAADTLMGVDEKGNYNFDKKLDRVLGFVGKVMMVILGNESFQAALDLVKNGLAAGISKRLGGAEIKTDSIAQTFAGLGAFVQGLGDGVAAMMMAAGVAEIMNVDTQKIIDIITAVGILLSGLTTITSISTLTSKLGDKAGWKAFEALAATGGGLAVALAAIGTVAGFLADWYLSIVETHLTTLAPTIYTFFSNLTGALRMIASLGTTELGSTEKILSEDLPRILGYINSERLGFNKDELDEVGQTIRDFGNRVYTGINSLSKAKDVFDKYNTDNNGFPLEFFQEMTEALQYLQNDEVTELYNSVFGQDGFWVGDKKTETDIDGLNSFFSTLGSLGWAMTSYNEFGPGDIHRSGTELKSTKEGLDAFQDAFAGIQTTFHSLMGDISNENFDIEKINTLSDFLVKVATAGDTFSRSFYYEHGSLKTFDNTSPITQFAGWLQSLGNSLHEAATAIQPEDEAGLTHINTVVNNLSAFFANDLYSNLQLLSVDQIGEYTSAFYALKQSLLMPENNSGTIADTLQAVMSAAGGNSMPLRVTPVVDDSNFGRNLPAGLSMENTYSRMLDMHIDTGELLNVHIDSAQISELVAANNQTRDMVNSLSVNINEVANAVQAMKIYLDTGVLAGAVDDYLGYSAFLAGRTG